MRAHGPLSVRIALISAVVAGLAGGAPLFPRTPGEAVAPRAAPANDACASATAIAEGTFTGSTAEATEDGATSCGSFAGTPDVWFLYTASADGEVGFDTVGSAWDFDTVLSLHSGCPGTVANELGCSDNEGGGAKSRVWLDMTAGDEVWVRLAGTPGSTGSYVLNVFESGTLSGTVTESGTATPLGDAVVQVFDASGQEVAFTRVASDGTWAVHGLPAGTHHALARERDHVNELYDDLSCPHACDATVGDPLTVSAGSETTGVDFALDPGGSIEGTVRDAATLAPIPWLFIVVEDGSGSTVGAGWSLADGQYRIAGLPTGTYYARIQDNSRTYVDTVYETVSCPFDCDASTGTAVPVTAGAATVGIDFELPAGGSISGTLTDAGSSAPLSGGWVRIYEGSRSRFANVPVDGATGEYAYGGLTTGAYYAHTWGTPDHADEVYDDQPCPGDLCDVATGTAIAVTLGSPTLGVDFALDSGGSVEGTVVDAATSAPLADTQVVLYDGAGQWLDSAWTAADGTYAIPGVPAGMYTARASSATHVAALYDGIDCPFSCDVTAGTTISVTAGATTAGIDFALDLGGGLAGTVTETGTGDPLRPVEIQVYDETGTYPPVATGHTESDGTWSVGGLPSGSYTLMAKSSTHLEELYHEIVCNFGCDVTAGTELQVTAGSVVSDVDFTLDPGGVISGTVRDETTTAPLASVEVRVYDELGWVRRTGTTAGDGTYSVGDLPTGGYFVRVAIPTHVAEVYHDLPCQAGCEVQEGTMVGVNAGVETTGIDFALTLAGVVTGAVTEVGSGVPLAGVPVTAYDALGRPVSSTSSAAGGDYVLGGLPTGDVYLMVGPTDTHAAQLFERLAYGCNVLAGNALASVPGTTISGTDFELWPLGVCALPAEMTVASVEIAAPMEYAACGDLLVGPGVEVLGTGEVAFRAGGTVALGDGVAVRTGGGLAASSGAIFPPQVGTLVYREDFDDGFALGWETSNGSCDLWRLDSSCGPAASGTHTLSFGRSSPDCDYDLGDAIPEGWVRSPVLDLSAASSAATLGLTHRWETEGSFDKRWIEVSADGGETWEHLWTWSSTSSGGFVTKTFDVLPYATSQFRFRLLFDTQDSAYNDYGGWYVDDVEVTVE